MRLASTEVHLQIQVGGKEGLSALFWTLAIFVQRLTAAQIAVESFRQCGLLVLYFLKQALKDGESPSNRESCCLKMLKLTLHGYFLLN